MKDEISVCYICGHSFDHHKIYTMRTGQYKYRTSIRCMKKIEDNDPVLCNCPAGFVDLNMTLNYVDTSTD